MKKIAALLLIAISSPAYAEMSDWALFLNAFGHTATAYLNDSYLLLGTTADGYHHEIIKKDAALTIADDVKRRVRIIRGKLQDASKRNIADRDRKLLEKLYEAYGCIDHLAWMLTEYINDKNPDNGKRYVEQRKKCLEHIQGIAVFYAELPRSREVAEPLSTR